MTKNTKIILGLSGLAIAFYLYNKNKREKLQSVETPSTGGSMMGNKQCPQGKKLIQSQCIKAPCPQICV